jgi:hypothetical protein
MKTPPARCVVNEDGRAGLQGQGQASDGFGEVFFDLGVNVEFGGGGEEFGASVLT